MWASGGGRQSRESKGRMGGKRRKKEGERYGKEQESRNGMERGSKRLQPMSGCTATNKIQGNLCMMVTPLQ